MALMNDEFADYLGKMVQITFGNENGKVLVGTVKSAEEDHVVILDATDHPHYVSYTQIAEFRETWDHPKHQPQYSLS